MDAVVRLGQLGRVALAYLVIERHRPIPRGELADALWGERLPRTWAAALRGAVARVRAVLSAWDASAALTSATGCYELRLSASTVVDVERLATQRQRAEALCSSSPGEAYTVAREVAAAAALDFLPGCTGDWVESQRRILSAMRLEALELAARAASAAGDQQAAVTSAEEAVRLDPLWESAYRILMSAHARAGNRSAALSTYDRCRRILAEELGVTPAAHTQAEYVALLEDSAGGDVPRDDPLPTHNLPTQLTTFVGRGAEVEAVKARLQGSRLLTLTGPAGIGKSRLAHRVASDLVADYEHGVWVVDLANGPDPDLLPEHFLAVIQAPEEGQGSTAETLVERLRHEQRLLILDNCDRLAPACGAIAWMILESCPHVRVLATSREPLAVAGESLWTVRPLSVPSPEDVGTLDTVLQHDGARLFVERTTEAGVQIDFGSDVVTFAHICARLEGIPLAIELAAARARTLSLRDIFAGLEDRLEFLIGTTGSGPPGRRALSAAISSSYEALNDSQRTMFLGLSAFVAGFTLDAAEVVCARPHAEVLGSVQALVEKSLLTAERDPDGMRYQFLDTVRSFGWQLLRQTTEHGAVIGRHLGWAASMVTAGEAALRGPEQLRWLVRLERDYPNLREAWRRAMESGQHEVAARVASGLGAFWEIRGRLGEGRSMLTSSLQHPDVSEGTRAKCLRSLAILAERQGDCASAEAYHSESLRLSEEASDPLGIAVALNGLGNAAVRCGELTYARSLFERNVALAEEAGNNHLLAAGLLNSGVLSQLMAMRGHTPADDGFAEANAYYERALGCYRALRDRYGEANALENLGALAACRRDLPLAVEFHSQSMSLRRQLGDKAGIALSARMLAQLSSRQGEYGMARQLQEESLAIERELGYKDRIARSLEAIAELAGQHGDFETAATALDEAVELYRELDDVTGVARALSLRGDTAYAQGELAKAVAVLGEAVEAATRWGESEARSVSLVKLARVTLARGDGAGGARMCGQVLTTHDDDVIRKLLPALVHVLARVAAAGGRDEDAARLTTLAATLDEPGPPGAGVSAMERGSGTTVDDLIDLLRREAGVAGGGGLDLSCLQSSA
jgi:predicted ATPase/DNA-binding SARP family transcriptional activator